MRRSQRLSVANNDTNQRTTLCGTIRIASFNELVCIRDRCEPEMLVLQSRRLQPSQSIHMSVSSFCSLTMAHPFVSSSCCLFRVTRCCLLLSLGTARYSKRENFHEVQHELQSIGELGLLGKTCRKEREWMRSGVSLFTLRLEALNKSHLVRLTL